MYSHCLFCNRDLGRNEVLEAFPVGRRLAYDAAKGRLWVVCPACARWNLTPLEERWEAIEQAERLFRGTRLRASTQNVGLARVADGTALVRVGAPLRPEFAAWRYGGGGAFTKRRQRQLLATSTLLVAAGGLAAAGIVAGVVGFGALWGWGPQLYETIVHGRPGATVARVRLTPDRVLYVSRAQLAATKFARSRDGTTVLRLAHDQHVTELSGDEMLRAARLVLPAANRYGGARGDVEDATRYIERAGGPAGVLADLVAPERRAARLGRRLLGDNTGGPANLMEISTSLRLALEMAVHEEQERLALNGEVAALERAWRDAEEIAAIADNLLVPASVQRAFTRLRGRDGGT